MTVVKSGFSVLSSLNTGFLGRVSYDAFAICFFGTCQVC